MLEDEHTLGDNRSRHEPSDTDLVPKTEVKLVRRNTHPAGLPVIAATLTVLLALSIAYANHQWSSYHWERPDANELVLTIGDCHTPSPHTNWHALLNAVAANWDWIPEYGNVPDFGVSKSSCGSGDIESYNDNYGDSGWLGIATIRITRGRDKHIVRGESKVNEYFITLNGYDGFDESIEWQHVLCQEIGHTFGLDHTDGDTCMNSDTRPLREPDPNYHDGEQLAEMYAHNHASDSGGGGGPGGPGGGGPPGPGGRGGQAPPSATAIARAFWAEQYESDAEMFAAADLVVEATVVSSAFNRVVGQGAAAVPVSQVLLQVTQALSGPAPQTIVLEQTRGLGLEIDDDPGYVQGDSYTLFLRQTGPNTFRTVNPDGRIRQ